MCRRRNRSDAAQGVNRIEIFIRQQWIAFHSVFLNDLNAGNPGNVLCQPFFPLKPETSIQRILIYLVVRNLPKVLNYE
jgi:hypothetical protein